MREKSNHAFLSGAISFIETSNTSASVSSNESAGKKRVLSARASQSAWKERMRVLKNLGYRGAEVFVT